MFTFFHLRRLYPLKVKNRITSASKANAISLHKCKISNNSTVYDDMRNIQRNSQEIKLDSDKIFVVSDYEQRMSKKDITK